MRKATWFFGMCVSILILAGCAGPRPPARDRTIQNVVRVLMHERGRYTIFSEPKTGNEPLVEENFYILSRVPIFKDVPPGGAMWAKVHTEYSYDLFDYVPQDTKLEIHVHGPEDINGAGWNHGKFGRGTTTVIQ